MPRGRDIISSAGRFVDLAGRGLSSVPANISGGRHWLSLRNNSISAISGSQFLFLSDELRRLELSYNNISSLRSLLRVPFWVSLRHLDLSHNSVRLLDRKLFERTPKLTYLDLSFNVISELEAECFEDLKILAFLSLSNNRIVHLYSAVFSGLSGLATIELDNNRINDIDADLFASLSSIETIFIAGNQISMFRTESLVGSDRFRRLDVSFNRIRSVGHLTLTRLRPLTYVIFDGNDVDRLWRHDFRSLTVREISLCRLPNLSVVDEEAFYHLENLEILSLNENPRLVYIHPSAFVGLGRLRVLDLHNSALFAVSENLVLTQPSLEVLSISGNPLHCDCNVRWMSEYFANATGNRNFTIDAEVVCDSPTDRRGWPLQRLRYLSDACRPVVIPLFSGTALMETGSTAVFTCRAIGLPVPVIHWILPSGERINGSVNDTRVKFDPSGSVAVENLIPSDSGTFTCLASNPRGYDAASVRLSIYSNAVSVLVRSVSWNFVSVSWNGTESTISSANYVILHRPEKTTTAAANRGHFGRVQLRPYMRAFTVTNLDSGTEYEFCIACERPTTGREATEQDVGDMKRLSCISVRTKDVPGSSVGISTLLDDGLLAEVLSLAALVAALGVVLAIVVRLRGRRSYREPRSFRLEKEDCPGAHPRAMSRNGGYVKSSVTKKQAEEDLMDELLQMKPVNITTSRTSLLDSYDV